MFLKSSTITAETFSSCSDCGVGEGRGPAGCPAQARGVAGAVFSWPRRWCGIRRPGAVRFGGARALTEDAGAAGRRGLTHDQSRRTVKLLTLGSVLVYANTTVLRMT